MIVNIEFTFKFGNGIIRHNNMEKEKEEILAKLMEEHPITELIQFNDINLQQKVQENTFMIVKYRDLWQREKAVLDELIDLYDKLVGERYDYYKFEQDKELTKPEIEKYYLPKDKKILQMKKIMRRQEIKVGFFEICFKAFEKQQWNLKLFYDQIK